MYTRAARVKEWVGVGRGWGYWDPRPEDLVGDGHEPIPVLCGRPVWDSDGTSPIPDAVHGTESRPWDLVGNGSGPLPDKVLGSGDATSPILDPYWPIP
jgi:hypothetical protein